MSKQPPPAPTASAVGPCPTVIQIVGRPGTGSLPSTIAPPDHPLNRKKEDGSVEMTFESISENEADKSIQRADGPRSSHQRHCLRKGGLFKVKVPFFKKPKESSVRKRYSRALRKAYRDMTVLKSKCESLLKQKRCLKKKIERQRMSASTSNTKDRSRSA